MTGLSILQCHSSFNFGLTTVFITSQQMYHIILNHSNQYIVACRSTDMNLTHKSLFFGQLLS